MPDTPTIAREDLKRIVQGIYPASASNQEWAAAAPRVQVYGHEVQHRVGHELTLAIRSHLNLGPEPIVVEVDDA